MKRKMIVVISILAAITTFILLYAIEKELIEERECILTDEICIDEQLFNDLYYDTHDYSWEYLPQNTIGHANIYVNDSGTKVFRCNEYLQPACLEYED